MRYSTAFSAAILAGSALAAPSYGGYGSQHKHVKNVHVVVETVVKTVYVTEGYEIPKPTSSSVSAAYEAPAKNTMPAYAPVKPTSTAVYLSLIHI